MILYFTLICYSVNADDGRKVYRLMGLRLFVYRNEHYWIVIQFRHGLPIPHRCYFYVISLQARSADHIQNERCTVVSMHNYTCLHTNGLILHTHTRTYRERRTEPNSPSNAQLQKSRSTNTVCGWACSTHQSRLILSHICPDDICLVIAFAIIVAVL